ncbi:hypothetical protein L195_g047110, partial [Trifolium pratense]
MVEAPFSYHLEEWLIVYFNWYQSLFVHPCRGWTTLSILMGLTEEHESHMITSAG